MDAPTYVGADYELYHALLSKGEFVTYLALGRWWASLTCAYGFNQLEEAGFSCTCLYWYDAGVSSNITPAQWYKGIVVDLLRSFCSSKVGFKNLLAEQERNLSPLQRLSQFIEDVLLVQLQK